MRPLYLGIQCVKAVEASVAGAQKFHKSQVESETDDEGDDL